MMAIVIVMLFADCLCALLTVHLEGFKVICNLGKRCRNSTEFPNTLHPASLGPCLFHNHRTLIKAEKSVLLQSYWLKHGTDSNFSGFSMNELFPLSVLSTIPHSLSCFVHLSLICWKSLYIKDNIPVTKYIPFCLFILLWEIRNPIDQSPNPSQRRGAGLIGTCHVLR